MLGRLAGRQIRPSLNRRPAAPDRLPDSTFPLPCRVWRAHTGPISGLVSSLAAFTAPVSLPTIYKNPTSLPPKLRRTFFIFPFPLSFVAPMDPLQRCFTSQKHCPFSFHRRCRSIRLSARSSQLDTMGYMPSVLRCL